MKKTFNPFMIVGSYIGMFVGYYFSLKGMNVFGFILYYINISTTSLMIGNLIGGFIAGYFFHVFIRAFSNMGMFKSISSKNTKKREIRPPKGL